MFADLRRQRCLGVDHRDVFLVEDDVVDSALNPLIAFRLWNRSKVNAVLSNKVEHIVFDSNLEDEDNSCRRECLRCLFS